jgi:hypothetical protein
MTHSAATDRDVAPTVLGRYQIFAAGRECGEDRWEIRPIDGGYVLVGEQTTIPPHPFPNRQEYRATLTEAWRLTGLEIVWTVGERHLRAIHAADQGMWRVRIEHDGSVREQQGDFPEFCEIEYATHLFHAFVLARRDFAVGGEHEFPALRIGPPIMAVTPERLLYRCAEIGSFAGPSGPVRAKRYVVSQPEQPGDPGYTFWADEDGFVLESYEGAEPTNPWMRLVELERPA